MLDGFGSGLVMAFSGPFGVVCGVFFGFCLGFAAGKWYGQF